MIDIDIVLLVLKVGILALLYLFVWRVVRAATASVRAGAGGGSGAKAAPTGVFAGGSGERRAQSQYERVGDRRGAISDTPCLVVEESRVLAAGVDVQLTGVVTVGRSPANDVVLDETVVSAAHAELRREGGAYIIRDLGSTNGTFVNGERVGEAQLTNGSMLRVGDTTFRYLG